MKIYTSTTWDWETCECIEEESFEYDGPVAQCLGSGGGRTVSSTTDNRPWLHAQPHLVHMFRQSGGTEKIPGASQVPMAKSMYPGQMHVDRNPLELGADAMRLGQATGVMPGQIAQAQGAWGDLLGSTDVANNPYVNQMIARQADTISDTLSERWLPAIQNDAVLAGQYGGSRQGIAEGQAVGQAADALANSAAQTQLDAYGRGLESMKYGLGFAPQMLNLGLTPSNIVENVGQGFRADESQDLAEQIQRHDFAQEAPWDYLRNRMGIIQPGLQFGTTTSTGPNPYQRNPLQTALGVGALGLGAFGGGMLPASIGMGLLT